MIRPMKICLLTLGVAVSLGGCTGKPAVSTSQQEATVSGTVKVRGQLITAGEVVFDPANYRRKDAVARTAAIGDDGTYKVKTLLGQNTVRLVLPADASKEATDDESFRDSAVDYDSIVFEVKRGENTLNIEMPTSRR